MRVRRRPRLLLAVLAVACFATTAHSQEADRETARPGPTLGTRSATARSMARPAPSEISVLPRYLAFQRDFARDFGVDPALALRDGDAGEDLWARFSSRWGDTTFHRWVERALVVYAQFEASTRFEKKGFNMDVQVDDVPEGKLGLRVSRALE